MGRPRKPIAQLKAQGTFREDRHGSRADIITGDIIPALSSVEVPPTLSDPYVRDFYSYHTDMLIRLGILQNADIPEIEGMCISLQSMRAVDKRLADIETDGKIISELDDYKKLAEVRMKLARHFSMIAFKYYVSPTSRAKLQLDALNLEKLRKENQSIVSKLLMKKRG